MSGTTPSVNLPIPPGGNMFVDEAGLPSGSNPGGVRTAFVLSFEIRAEDGVDELTVGGYRAISDGVFTPGGLQFSYGSLMVTDYDPGSGRVTVRYELTSAYQNFPGPQGKYGDIDGYEVVLTDTDGDVATGQLVVQIRDDEGLTVRGDSAAATAGGAAIAGDLVANDSFTADGFGGVWQIAGGGDLNPSDSSFDEAGRLTVEGDYGVLTVDAQGAYSYRANADAPDGVVDRYAYWVKDGDGDQGWNWLTVTVQRPAAEPPPASGGQVITSPGPGSTLTGGAGDDTLNASQGSDVLTGAGGADVFAWSKEPWSPATVTDFTVGADRLDLSALFQAAGYSGADPVADKRIVLLGQGSDTLVLFDDDGEGGDWPNYVIKLQGVSNTGLTWTQLSGAAGEEPPPPPSGGEGEVIDSPGPGSTLTGGGGDDTLNASQGPDVLTGAGGADAFTFRALPWNAGRVTDFTVGTDRLDLSAIFQASGYSSADPAADGRVTFQSDGAGGTEVYFDVDGPGGEWPFRITTLENVSPANLTWADLQGAGAGPGSPPAGDDGEVLTWSRHGDTLTGGAGNDTLNASQGPDQLTGGGGADRFVWSDLPWNAGRVTDFAPGTDALDLRALLEGYAGSDPVGDGWLEFRADGAGGTQVYVDHDGPAGGDWPFLITTLQGVSPGQIGAGDWLA